MGFVFAAQKPGKRMCLESIEKSKEPCHNNHKHNKEVDELTPCCAFSFWKNFFKEDFYGDSEM